MARIVNFSMKPCTDFRAYVCQSQARGSSIITSMDEDAKRVVTTAAKSEGATRGKAGQFLTAYFKSCLETVSRREHFFSDVAFGLLGAVKELVSKPDTRNAMTFMLTVSLKYDLESWITAYADTPYEIKPYEISPYEILLEVDLGCPLKSYSMEALDALNSALQKMINVTAATQEAVGIRNKLCSTRFPDLSSSFPSPYLLDDIVNKGVWGVQEVKAGLDMLGYSVTTVRVRNASAMRAIYNIFAAPARGTADGLKAAYLMWRTVEKVLALYLVSDRMSTVVVFKTCKDSLEEMWEIRDKLHEELYAQTEYQGMATSVFAAVKEAVYRDCRASQLFQSEDPQRLENFRNISLLLSLQDSAYSVPFPTPDQHFTAILLQGRAYSTEWRRKVYNTRGEVLEYENLHYYIDQNLIYFTPNLYRYAFPHQSFSSDLLSMAVLGREMAEGLWSIVLSDLKWGSKTADNIRRLSYCFDVTVTSGNDSYEYVSQAGIRTAADALGLASTLKTFNRPDWYNVKPAWSLWKLSHAQLFYIFSTFPRCLRDMTDANVVLKHLRDFAKAFRCSVNAPTRNGSSCIPSGIRTE
ncbi:hypothetical protein HPB48_018124 [Haemaphysalis longicornis]|uniref:Uncharacterized protein n=1 Tax=Haemaphysalis longicornis TaxID=44386 RepID=A0A9J6FLI0_HAELO|nr:hypothetical protein HPB48_018124 [Haemaphysalis longicornis]